MSNNVRLAIAIALSLGVVLAFGLLDRSKAQHRPAAPDAAAQVDAGAPPSVPTPAAAAPAMPAPATPSPAVPVAAAPDAPAAPAAAPAASAAPAPAVAPPPGEQRETLRNAAVELVVSSHRGAVVQWKLLNARFAEKVAGQEEPLDMANAADGVLGLYCYDAADAAGNYADLCPSDYTLRREAGGIVADGIPRPGARVTVRQTLSLGMTDDPYAVRRTITIAPAQPGTVVQNLVVWTSVAEASPRNTSGGGFFGPKANVQQGMCRVGGDLSRADRGHVDTPPRIHGSVAWVGVQDTYFLAAFGLAKHEPASRKDFCVLDLVRADPRQPMRATLQLAPMDLSESRDFPLIGHLGPKTLDLLRSIPALDGLDSAIDYGWFGPLCIVMMRVMHFFQSLVSVWGIAIILLTVLVKVVMLPLTHWSMVSMRRMSALKPLLDEINEKYKDDKQRKNQAVMDLYKTHKVNPLGGCFPMLLQMPIWIALYRMLGASAELYHVEFLYLPDLTQKDPYFILPIVLGVSMFVQQKMTPTTGDSSQAKIMLWAMPIMFTVFMLFLPSGLNLYILTNTVLSIAQQQITNRFVPQPVLAAAKGASAVPRGAAADELASGTAGGRSRRKR